MDREAIDQLQRFAAESRDVISLAGGLPAAESFPREVLAAAAAEVSLHARDADPLQYDWPEGRSDLRARIAATLTARGADVEANDVVVTDGAQDAIALAIEVLAPHEVGVGEVSYPGALELLRARGVSVVPQSGEVAYVMPALGNPSGRALSVAERGLALEARWIIEDDAYADLRFDGPPRAPLLAGARDTTFHVGSFSKTLAPGLRVGWLVPPRPWLDRVREAKRRRDLHAGGLAQAIVARVLETIDFERRLEMLRELYARRCARLAGALGGVHGIRFTAPDGGLSLWVHTDVRAEDEAWLGLAVRCGVAFDPGCLFVATPEPAAPLAMRLSFSTVPEEDLERAVGRLDDALRLQRRRATSTMGRTAYARRSPHA